MKNPLTQAGIEPATYRFVVQHLNHCATAVPFNTSVLYTNTRHKIKLHKPAVRLTMYQRSVYYNSVNICN